VRLRTQAAPTLKVGTTTERMEGIIFITVWGRISTRTESVRIHPQILDTDEVQIVIFLSAILYSVWAVVL